MSLWIPFGTMAAAVVALMLWPLRRRRAPPPARADYDLQVYRDQLRDLEIDHGRGLITAEEAAAARTEIERRILAAGAARDSGASEAPPNPDRHARVVAAAVVMLAVPLGAGLLYWRLGNPDLPDEPLAARTAEASAESGMGPDIEQAMAKLAERLKETPDDLNGWLLLARSSLVTGRFDAAVNAYREAAALAPENNDIATALGEAIIYSHDGIVTPAARQQFDAVLARDPGHQIARYYKGLDRGQAGARAEALAIWTALAEDAEPDAAWLPDLRRQLRDLAKDLGVEPPVVALAEAAPSPAPPPVAPRTPARAPAGTPPPGPTPEDRAAAAEMAPADRMAMIRSMVARLDARLQQSPDDVEGWKRLGNARRVLGENAAARDAYARAVALAPHDLDALGPYAEILVAMAGGADAPVPAAAEDAYRRILAIDSNREEALWTLGLAAAQQGRRDEAAALWRRLLARLPADSAEAQRLTRRLAELDGGG